MDKLSYLGIFGLYEISSALKIWWAAGVILYTLIPLKAVMMFLVVTWGYTACMVPHNILMKSISKKLGLQRYIIVPVPFFLTKLLLRGRIALHTKKRCFLIHIRKANKPSREVFRQLQNDLEFGLKSEWGEDAIFIGNTFGSLGFQHKKLLHTRVLEEVEGTFFPLQTLGINIKKAQKNLFGRVFTNHSTWKIFVSKPI